MAKELSSSRVAAKTTRMRDAARDELIEGHVHLVLVLAGQFKNRVGDAMEFDELVSLGYQGLVSAAARFKRSSGVRFATFVYGRIRGEMLDGLRRNRRRAAKSVDAVVFLAVPTGEDLVIQREAEAIVHTVLESLPDSRSGILRLHYFEGLSITECAGVLGISKSWASRLRRRSLEEFRYALERRGKAAPQTQSRKKPATSTTTCY